MRDKCPQFSEAGTERCVFVSSKHGDGSPVNLEELRGIKLEPDEELIILVMNTDDLLILYTDSARHSVDDLEALINVSFEATPRTPVDQYLGMHITRDKDKGLLSIDARRNVYDFIRGMGYDPLSGPTVSTPLDPHIKYSKEDCPPTVNVPK